MLRAKSDILLYPASAFVSKETLQDVFCPQTQLYLGSELFSWAIGVKKGKKQGATSIAGYL